MEAQHSEDQDQVFEVKKKMLILYRCYHPIPSLSFSQPFLKNISAFIAHLQTHKSALSDIVQSSS